MSSKVHFFLLIFFSKLNILFFSQSKKEHILLKILHKRFLLLNKKTMNFCFVYTYMGVGGRRGEQHSYSSFWRFSYLFAHLHFLSYLFFQNTNVGIIVYVVVVVYTKNGTNPSKFRPRTHFDISAISDGMRRKRHNFQGFSFEVYTKMKFIFLFLTRHCRAEKGSDQ